MTIQRTFPFTSAAGTDPSRGASFNIFAVISAFPDPMATKIFSLAALTTGKENVTRSGGGFGESAMGKIHPSSRFKARDGETTNKCDRPDRIRAIRGQTREIHRRSPRSRSASTLANRPRRPRARSAAPRFSSHNVSSTACKRSRGTSTSANNVLYAPPKFESASFHFTHRSSTQNTRHFDHSTSVASATAPTPSSTIPPPARWKTSLRARSPLETTLEPFSPAFVHTPSRLPLAPPSRRRRHHRIIKSLDDARARIVLLVVSIRLVPPRPTTERVVVVLVVFIDRSRDDVAVCRVIHVASFVVTRRRGQREPINYSFDGGPTRASTAPRSRARRTNRRADEIRGRGVAPGVHGERQGAMRIRSSFVSASMTRALSFASSFCSFAMTDGFARASCVSLSRVRRTRGRSWRWVRGDER